MLPPEYEQAIAVHIHATTTTLATGHVPMLSRPKQVAAVIIEAANTPFTALDAAHSSAQSVFPGNFRTQEIQADGATIHVRVGGQGPAVVHNAQRSGQRGPAGIHSILTLFIKDQ